MTKKKLKQIRQNLEEFVKDISAAIEKLTFSEEERAEERKVVLAAIKKQLQLLNMSEEEIRAILEFLRRLTYLTKNRRLR